jgi:hypothetical protein
VNVSVLRQRRLAIERATFPPAARAAPTALGVPLRSPSRDSRDAIVIGAALFCDRTRADKKKSEVFDFS